jgi:hypothetical protein
MAMQCNQRIVIVLDEIGAVSFSAATGFFSVLRDIYNSRQAEVEFRQISFLLAGAFHPRDLIADDKISPFNIAQRIRLTDFSLEEVKSLARKGDWPETQANLLAQSIHDWVDGQPYLTQLLCSYLEPNATSADVDAAVERLRRDDENHLPPILKQLLADERLNEYVVRIRAGEQIKFYPTQNPRQAKLELLGVIKADRDGNCMIRNRLCELALQEVITFEAKVTTVESVSLAPKKSDHYAELKRNLKSGNVIAFVGAGLSVGAGLPGWYDLIKELAQQIDYELPPAQWATSESLIDAAQAFVNERNLNSLIMFLEKKLDTTGKSPTAAHLALAGLPISFVFTGNYDDLLEKAYEKIGKRVKAVVQESSIPSMLKAPNVVNLIKLYGDLDQPDTIVLARQQYDSFFQQRIQLIKMLETDLSRSDVIYLGWSHSDPHFNLILGELATRFGDFQRMAYAVMFDVPESKRKELKRKHIHLIELPSGDRTEQIANWLNGLVA